MYELFDAAVLRAAVHTEALPVAVGWPDLTGDSEARAGVCRRWLARVWRYQPAAEAIEVASPVLAGQIRRVCAGHCPDARQTRRMATATLRYLLRMTSRATPFGLFAGVAPARFASQPELRWGDGHRVRAGVDAVWLARVIDRLEASPDLLIRLPVVASNLAAVRGQRLVVPCQPGNDGRDDVGGSGPARVSVRHTPAVATAMRAARSPVPLGDLSKILTAEYPDAPRDVIDGMLAELVRRRFLITALRPPTTVTDPLRYLIERLETVGAETVESVVCQTKALREVHDDLRLHNRTGAATVRREIRARVAEHMGSMIRSVDQPLAVDLLLDATVTLPPAVAGEAVAAATALTRLTPYPCGAPAWRDYHGRFIERYGIGALVPVTDLIDPGVGLGLPARYRDTLQPAPEQRLSARDSRLLALAQRATIDGATEIVLDEPTIAELAAAATGGSTPIQVSPHAELRFHLEAPTMEAVDQGRFRLVVVGTPRAAGTTTGRFLDLLDPADRDRMTRIYRTLPGTDPEAEVVQVSCPPLHPRTANVVRAPAITPNLLGIAEHTSGEPETMAPDDLLVGADAQRLYLLSRARRTLVEPTVFHAVDFRNHTQPIVRFLCELTKARAAVYTPFYWGAASRLPFLPRIRSGRTVVSAARWILTARDLPGPQAPWPDWAQRLVAWRRRFQASTTVWLGEGDRRIRLDLDQPAHLALLRTQLGRDGEVVLTEAPEPGGWGWCGDRAHEIVVPLASTTASVWPTIPPRRGAIRVTGPDHGHLPGASAWLFAKIYGHPDRQTDILTTHLPDLLAEWADPPEWWFLRYADPQPHLRIRLRLPTSDEYGPATKRLGTWATQLRHLGLINQVQLDTDHPETGRFGTGPAMSAAQTVFAADSTAAVAQLAATAVRGGPDHHALAAASLLDLAAGFTGTPEAGAQWLISNRPTTPSSPTPRATHRQAVALADPRDDWATLRACPGADPIVQAWSRRAAALRVYRARLADDGDVDPDMVLAALLHLHHVRLLGIDPASEAACHRLARAAALASVARAGHATPTGRPVP
ncbi:MAG: lantibiotic dehydratase [Dactylosporangium sp.]|nr:lantibiotic dehydratase [Dactylosporangium sp.]NNJ61917.1 lantibiotic dehydratase [Dactylosporangium sp.]